MRKTLLLVGVTLLFAAMPLVAQEKNALPAVAAAVEGVEDSDLLIGCSDYYSGKDFVRTGPVTYNVRTGEGYGLYVIELSNVGNKILCDRPIPNYNEKADRLIVKEYAFEMVFDRSQIKSILREVFPEYSFEGKDGCSIVIRAAVDPKNGSILEVEFDIMYRPDKKYPFAIPPHKFRELETIIKERVITKCPPRYSEVPEIRRHDVYHLAGDRFFFE